ARPRHRRQRLGSLPHRAATRPAWGDRDLLRPDGAGRPVSRVAGRGRGAGGVRAGGRDRPGAVAGGRRAARGDEHRPRGGDHAARGAGAAGTGADRRRQPGRDDQRTGGGAGVARVPAPGLRLVRGGLGGPTGDGGADRGDAVAGDHALRDHQTHQRAALPALGRVVRSGRRRGAAGQRLRADGAADAGVRWRHRAPGDAADPLRRAADPGQLPGRTVPGLDLRRGHRRGGRTDLGLRRAAAARRLHRHRGAALWHRGRPGGVRAPSAGGDISGGARGRGNLPGLWGTAGTGAVERPVGGGFGVGSRDLVRGRDGPVPGVDSRTRADV
ncbi:MAG: hypothetical protein AVDCRST_MAG73-312, partial [uncultured Thermomicrobiales bacterium]